jgi:tRNA 2-thiouridine synthesizing protein A
LKQIDVRGLACPQPVIDTQQALNESPEGVDILVDSVTAKNNIERFVKLSGYQVDGEETADGALLLRVRR